MEVKVTLRNPLDKKDTLDYYIVPNDTQLAQDWVSALEEVVKNNLHLEKNYCFMGFPKTQRTIEYLCEELNQHVKTINLFNYQNIWQKNNLDDYIIYDHYTPDHIRWPADYEVNNIIVKGRPTRPGLSPKDKVMNELHNHFEILQGTVENPSKYYELADTNTKYAIRQLNNLCHELENLILSQRKSILDPEWIRPSQITTFFGARRYNLTDDHRQGFLTNGYNRQFGHVYMHWCQIGKTLYEVFRDEKAPDLDEATCDAITHLQYYSGEFDVEWGQSVTRYNSCPWHDEEQLEFENWLLKNGFDPRDPKLSLGYLDLGEINLIKSFGTNNRSEVWEKLSKHLDIYKIEVNGVTATYDYGWSDNNFQQQQKQELGYEVD